MRHPAEANVASLQKLRNRSATRIYKHPISSEEYTLSEDVTCHDRLSHSRQWDADVGSMLSAMMDWAGYSDASQSRHRKFFASRAAQSLGPHPRIPHCGDDTPSRHWKSFMTDGHTPVELSWSWGAADSTPTVRYAIEPIGWAAGSARDPLNTTESIHCLGNSLASAPTPDVQWYRYFLNTLTATGKDRDTLPALGKSPLSQAFIGFDLDDRDMTVKYYFLPSLRSATEGKSNLALVEESILAMPGAGRQFATALAVLTDYIRAHNEPAQPTVEIFAVDCVRPADSRLKVYVRSRETSFASMVNSMTLGGRLPALSKATVASLAELWCACFGLQNTPDELGRPLRPSNHRTAGLLYYFELRTGAALPTAKVYLPVRHYAQNDEQVARGLSAFLEKRGKRLSQRRTYYEGVKSLW